MCEATYIFHAIDGSKRSRRRYEIIGGLFNIEFTYIKDGQQGSILHTNNAGVI